MKDILRQSYDRSADGYDDAFRPLQRVKYEALLGARAEALAPALDLGGRVLDLGCGTGLLAEWLGEARGAAPARPLVGLDLSARMLARARGRGVAAVHGDLERLPFASASFGAVVAFTALAITPGPLARALVEVARVLRPGGLFVVSVLARSAPADLDREMRAAGLLPGPRRACGQDVGWVAARGR